MTKGMFNKSCSNSHNCWHISLKVNCQSWNGEKTERKLAREAKHNRKIESLCSLLCDRLAHTASLFCETLGAQVKLKKHSSFSWYMSFNHFVKVCHY